MLEVEVFRYNPAKDDSPQFRTYTVPYTEGMTVLGVLQYIRENLDPALAFRYGCRSGDCGVCTAVVNEIPTQICISPVQEKKLVIKPLPSMPVIRDLVTDRATYTEIFRRVRPFLERAKIPIDKIEPISKDTIQARLNIESCVECFACSASCPVSTNFPSKFPGPTLFLQLSRFVFDPRDEANRVKTALSEGLYECSACMNCEEHCLQEIKILKPILESLKALAVEGGLVKNPLIRNTLTNTYKYGNPWGEPANTRSEWAKNIEVKTFEDNNDLEILYLVGCTASYDKRCQEIAKSLVTIFNKASVNFGILGNEEKCCGGPILELGEKGLFEMLAEENTRTFGKYGIYKIVATSPHCYNTLVKDYHIKEKKIEVQHYTQFLLELIEQGKLSLSRKIDKVVTYHDPCFLGRYNKVYDAPRKILEAIPGLSLVEMPRNKENSFCCGGGGGRIWIEEAPADERPSVIRAREAVDIDPDILVTACPFCLINLDDAIKVIDKAEEIQVKDIAEIVEEAI